MEEYGETSEYQSADEDHYSAQKPVYSDNSTTDSEEDDTYSAYDSEDQLAVEQEPLDDSEDFLDYSYDDMDQSAQIELELEAWDLGIKGGQFLEDGEDITDLALHCFTINIEPPDEWTMPPPTSKPPTSRTSQKEFIDKIKGQDQLTSNSGQSETTCRRVTRCRSPEYS